MRRNYLSYAIAISIVLASALLTAGASWLVSRTVLLEKRRHYHDVGMPVFAQLGLLLSVLIAFVFSGTWEDYRTANAAISLERSELHGAAIVASSLPSGGCKPVERAILSYSHAVASDEWLAMKHRKLSARARVAFENVIRQATLCAPAAPQLLTLVMQAHDQRETRTYQLLQSVPPFIWLTVLALFVLQTGFLVFAGIEQPAHLLFAAAVSAAAALVLVSIRLLDFPFEGALALTNADFVQLSQQVSALLARSGGG